MIRGRTVGAALTSTSNCVRAVQAMWVAVTAGLTTMTLMATCAPALLSGGLPLCCMHSHRACLSAVLQLTRISNGKCLEME